MAQVLWEFKALVFCLKLIIMYDRKYFKLHMLQFFENESNRENFLYLF